MANDIKAEKDRVEYKSLRIRNREDMDVDKVLKMFQKGKDCKQNELNAMLNYGGGKVHFGIAEIQQCNVSTEVVIEKGIKLSDGDIEKINDAIHRTFTEFHPSCSSDRGDYKIEWETKTKTNKDGIEQRFTIVINKCTAYNRGNKDLMDEVLKMFKKGIESKQKLNAMLNYEGGEVHFGIGKIVLSDVSKAFVEEEGIKLSNEEIEKINDAIHRTFFEFNPPCSSDRGDYEIEWIPKNDKDGVERHRFTVIINRCSTYNRGDIVFMNNVSRLEAYTRTGSLLALMPPEMIKENIKQTALIERDDDVKRTQASIDATLILRLHDVLDKYDDNRIQAAGIIRILKQYAKVIDRQKYLSNVLVEGVLDFMERFASCSETEIEIADEIVNLCDCICCIYFLLYIRNDEAGKNRVQNTAIHLFEVCFSVAHISVKYRRDDNMFAKATALLAKILNNFEFASLKKDDRRIKNLFQRYEQLLSSIRDSKLDGLLKAKLESLHQLLWQLSVETDDNARFGIEKKILELGYYCSACVQCITAVQAK